MIKVIHAKEMNYYKCSCDDIKDTIDGILASSK